MVTLTLAVLARDNRLLLAVRKLYRTVSASFRAMLAGIDEAREMAARYETLSRLSDAELRQRGLMRSDIPRIIIGRGIR
jgi:hypothetical protein